MKRIAVSSVIALSGIVAVLALGGCEDQANVGGGSGRSEIRIVGSSTVYPFAKAVAERFLQADSSRVAPVLESTGTGGGIEQFCSGVGLDTPDIVNASRRMKKSELESCKANGVAEVVEVQVGIDGIAIGQANEGPQMALSPADVYKALAANPYGKPQTAKTWRDVNPALPAMPIAVFGPPSTSGTRDAFQELMLMRGCDADPAMVALKKSDKDQHEKICTEIRTDSAFNEQGENDNLIVQKLVANPNNLGIFGYSYLEANLDKLRGVPVDSVKPTYDSIANGTYPGARPLYIYIKKAHVGQVAGLKEYVAEFVKAGVQDAYLTKLGLIPEPADKRRVAETSASEMTALDIAQLK